MEELKFIGNSMKNPTARNVINLSGQSIQDAVENYKRVQSLHIIGRPQATEKYSVEQLEKMGMIGLYREETDKEILARVFRRYLIFRDYRRQV